MFTKYYQDDMNENKIDIDDDLLEKVTGGDGTLPGGMPPDMLQKLSEYTIFILRSLHTFFSFHVFI